MIHSLKYRKDNMLDKLNEVLEKVPENRHSFFQLNYFVIGKEVTNQSRMWQCLRELQARKEAIDNYTNEIEELKDQIELNELHHEKTKFEEKEWIIRCRQYERTKKRLNNTINQLEKKKQFAIQEAKFFLQTFQTINEVEPMKDFDDPEAQKEYWNEKISQQINLKLLLHQPLDTELVKTALALPDDLSIKKQITHTLNHIAQLKEKNATT
jgi:hypothetical protein